MKFFKFAGTIPALALGGLLSMAIEAHASTLVVDRGLPAENLNNAAGSNRSNVAWGFNGAFHTGDTFSLPSTGNSALPSWRVDKLTTWFVSGSPDPQDNFQLESRFNEISLFLGTNLGAGSSINRAANSSITGNVANAANVTITPVTYGDGQNYQGSGGGDIQIWQVDFTDLGTFSAGDYAFSVAGLPDDDPFFNHASNADLGGVVADGSDNQYAWFSGSAADASLTLGGFIDSNGNGWDKASDINVQVTAAPIPLPAAGWLLLTAFGGLGIAARRRKAA